MVEGADNPDRVGCTAEAREGKNSVLANLYLDIAAIAHQDGTDALVNQGNLQGGERNGNRETVRCTIIPFTKSPSRVS